MVDYDSLEKDKFKMVDFNNAKIVELFKYEKDS